MKSAIAVILLLFCSSLDVHAASLRILSAEFDPYTFKSPGGGSGVCYEIVAELAKRVGQSSAIEFLPWARAQFIAKHEPNIGILPLARSSEREKDYLWLISILKEPYVFFATKASKADISTIASAKTSRIGIFGGSIAEAELKKNGFKHLLSVSEDSQNVKMLKAGRIDAWVAPLSFKSHYKVKGGLSEDELRVGATLVELDEYFATSKNLDEATANKWKEAFQKMKSDGSYAAIMKKYGFKPLD